MTSKTVERIFPDPPQVLLVALQLAGVTQEVTLDRRVVLETGLVDWFGGSLGGLSCTKCK